MSRDELWMQKYLLLERYIAVRHQLPDKKKVENRGLLNWWKYNMKQLRKGKLTVDKQRLLEELGERREKKKPRPQPLFKREGE